MKKEILVTNDDSVSAKGIRYLANMLRDYGNVTVVAPRDPQSAKSAALTMGFPLRLTKMSEEEGSEARGSLKIYNFTGTPCDCIKFGINMFIEAGTMPDMIASGINHGANTSAAAIYSGTLGAVKEGVLYGVPSLGFSICTHEDDPDFSAVDRFGRVVLDKFIANPPAKNVFLNVNFPNLPADEVKGIRFGRQGAGRWIREFVKLEEPRGNEFYWMVGDFTNLDTTSCDGFAPDHILTENGYVSVVAHSIDTTDYAEIERLDSIWRL